MAKIKSRYLYSVALILLGLSICFIAIISQSDLSVGSKKRAGAQAHLVRKVIITNQRKTHILYGDKTGGGHLHGLGKPCKSEFPEDWDEEEILDTVKRIAANDNLPWEQQDNGYHVAESYEGRTRVRVVLGPQKQKIITAYPTNVQRNPCPANDR